VGPIVRGLVVVIAALGASCGSAGTLSATLPFDSGATKVLDSGRFELPLSNP
jgi:hypothetical protein